MIKRSVTHATFVMLLDNLGEALKRESAVNPRAPDKLPRSTHERM